MFYTKEVRPEKSSEEPIEKTIEDSDDSQDYITEEFQPEALNATEFYKRFVQRTEIECNLEMEAPQRSLLWHKARKHAITASNFGAAIGNNPYSSPKKTVIEKLWSSFKGNEFTEYGSFHESDAENSLKSILDNELLDTLKFVYFGTESSDDITTKILTFGLLKSYEQPWAAVSPDGILQIDGPLGPKYILLEYKCPARLRDTDSHPYAKYKYNVPGYYMDQIQGIMGYLNKYSYLISKDCSESINKLSESALTCALTCALFIVWQPHQMHITMVPYEKTYYTNLEKKLEEFYFELYLPHAVLQYNGLLKENSLDSGCIITI